MPRSSAEPKRPLTARPLPQPLTDWTARRSGEIAGFMISIDRFDAVTEVLGADAGETMARTVLDRLTSWVGRHGCAAPLGGARFAATLSGHADAMAAAARLPGLIAEPVRLGASTVSRSASVGIALDIDHSMPVDMLFARAARACDRVQAAGGDGVALFDAVAEARRTERMRLDLDLHAAVTGGQLGLHFQPEFDLATGQPLAVEALLRWQHPHLGLLSAQRFIPATEPTRTFAAVQRWVFDQCCRRLVAWREGPLAGLLLRMNVSGARLANSATVDTLLRAVDEHGVAPERLCVEITESRMPDELDPLVEQGSRLRTAGISVALDDVGTGQNTPTLLMTLPIDTMKLDRSFVAGLRSGTRYETMVQAFMGTAGSFGYQVVAEGVDGPQTVAALLELGCHRGQGNFLAPAVAEADLPEAIAAGGPGGWRSS